MFLVLGLAIGMTLFPPTERANVALAAECTPSVGPSIPPPATIPSGIPGFHAYWYGQSGYPTLCPGETSVATVAFYNSGSAGWAYYSAQAALGTSGPQPGQDQTSLLGGDWTHGSPNTHWSEFHRPAIQPAPWIGPNQVAWFQFTVKAPPTPGTYRLYLRPLIEGLQWLEDFGVFWQVTVIPTSTAPQRMTVESVDTGADVFTAGGTHFLYDRNDDFQYGDETTTYEYFELRLTAGDVVDVRYEPSAPERSTFVIIEDSPYTAPNVAPQIGNFDHGTTNNDIRVDASTPQGGTLTYVTVVQRAAVAAGTTVCWAGSGSYVEITGVDNTPYVDENVPSGTYCYRVFGGMFGYSAPITMPSPPAPAAPEPAPLSLDARTTSSSGGSAATYDFGDRLVAVFDQPMRACAANTTVRLRDADGTVAELNTSTRNIACERNEAPQTVGGTTYPAFRVITLTVAASPTILEAGTTPGLQLPATAQIASGIVGDGGLAWNVAGSTDLVFGEPD